MIRKFMIGALLLSAVSTPTLAQNLTVSANIQHIVARCTTPQFVCIDERNTSEDIVVSLQQNPFFPSERFAQVNREFVDSAGGNNLATFRFSLNRPTDAQTTASIAAFAGREGASDFILPSSQASARSFLGLGTLLIIGQPVRITPSELIVNFAVVDTSGVARPRLTNAQMSAELRRLYRANVTGR